MITRNRILYFGDIGFHDFIKKKIMATPTILSTLGSVARHSVSAPPRQLLAMALVKSQSDLNHVEQVDNVEGEDLTPEQKQGQASRWPWYEWFPLINLLYELLFDEPPTFEMLEKTMNMIGLVDALMLTIVISIPMSFEYDEVLSIDEKFSPAGDFSAYWADLPEHEIPNSHRLQYWFSNAINYLSMAFISVFITYTVSANTFRPNADPAEAIEEMRRWWIFGRWALLTQILLTMLGFLTTYTTVFIVIESKFPDESMTNEFYDRKNANVGNGANPFEWLIPFKIPHPWRRSSSSSTWAAGTATFGTALLLSAASAHRYWHKRQKQAFQVHAL